jgi:hypothetical protein
MTAFIPDDLWLTLKEKLSEKEAVVPEKVAVHLTAVVADHAALLETGSNWTREPE